jgi:hypothetical protein
VLEARGEKQSTLGVGARRRLDSQSYSILFQYRLVDKCLLLCWRSYHRIAQSTQQYNQIKTTENAKMASKGG